MVIYVACWKSEKGRYEVRAPKSSYSMLTKHERRALVSASLHPTAAMTSFKTALLFVVLFLSCLYTQAFSFSVLEKSSLESTTELFAGAPDDRRTLDAVNDRASSEITQELLSLLVNHVKTKGIRAKDERIENLMQQLVDQRVKFDPAACLNGKLFSVAYQSGPAPFWVKYSKLSPPKTTNIEGQQYTLRTDGGFDVINYGEFFSKGVTVRARGVAYQEPPDEDKNAATTKKTASLFDSFLQSNVPSSKKLQCPVSFDVEVDKACFNLLGKSFPLDISGSAKFTVLYADPDMRILTTKASSQIEEKGFSAVQIRVNHLDPDFPILSFPL